MILSFTTIWLEATIDRIIKMAPQTRSLDKIKLDGELILLLKYSEQQIFILSCISIYWNKAIDKM